MGARGSKAYANTNRVGKGRLASKWHRAELADEYEHLFTILMLQRCGCELCWSMVNEEFSSRIPVEHEEQWNEACHDCELEARVGEPEEVVWEILSLPASGSEAELTITETCTCCWVSDWASSVEESGSEDFEIVAMQEGASKKTYAQVVQGGG